MIELVEAPHCVRCIHFEEGDKEGFFTCKHGDNIYPIEKVRDARRCNHYQRI